MVELKIKSKVGPKGQVVIPYVIRQIHKIRPNSEVIFEHKGNQIIIEASEDNPIKAFERSAMLVKQPRKVDSNKDYNKRMETYWRKKLKK